MHAEPIPCKYLDIVQITGVIDFIIEVFVAQVIPVVMGNSVQCEPACILGRLWFTMYSRAAHSIIDSSTWCPLLSVSHINNTNFPMTDQRRRQTSIL